MKINQLKLLIVERQVEKKVRSKDDKRTMSKMTDLLPLHNDPFETILGSPKINDDLQNFNKAYFVKCMEYRDIIRPKLSETKIFPKGSILEAIYDDDINKFIIFTSDFDFNPEKTFNIQNESLFFLNQNPVTYVQLMAFFGSVKCFKYALLDGSFSLEGTSEYAIAGGNNEIIHLLEQQNIRFDNCLTVSVKFHRYEISDWLLSNYKCEKITLLDAIEFFNMRAFFFLYDKNTVQNKILAIELLEKSANNGNLELTKFLVNEFPKASKAKALSDWYNVKSKSVLENKVKNNDQSVI